MNMENTKYKNMPDNDLLESRLLKLESQIHELIISGVSSSSNNLAAANPSGDTNIRKQIRNTLSLSEGQVTAQMAIAMSRSSQRNS